MFPQLHGLGYSRDATCYGISFLQEAHACLAHPVLGPRLQEATRAMLKASGQSLAAIPGAPDDQKFCSCMTLLAQASPEEDALFSKGLARWCGGAMDEATLRLTGLSKPERKDDGP
ncbi:DUF1810 family protein [Nitratireductor sp. ac15]